MKKVIIAVLVVVMLCGLVGCAVSKDQRVAEIMRDCGFVVIKHLDTFGDYYMYLVYDENTKVEYIYTGGYCTHSLCPYYDDTGNVVIYEGD